MAMKMGIVSGNPGETFEEAVDTIVQAEADGFASVWRPNIFALDALTVLAVAGQRTSRIELGTAVVPTYPRHPHSLAQQAATVDRASDGRLSLGIGRSHQVVIESMFGLEYNRPISHIREYVQILRSLFENGSVAHEGKNYTVNAPLEIPDLRPVPIFIGALMPKMLEVCGEYCDGTLTWMCGPKFVEQSIVPPLRAASERTGRKMPRVVVSLPVCVTDDEPGARETAAKLFVQYGYLPVYRACLDAEGAAGPGDIALVGTEDEVRAGLERVAASGATDFYAGIFPHGDADASRKRTYDFLKSLGGEV